MTLWVRKFGLILGLAFFIFACEEPSEIGLELNPENGNFVAKYGEIPIPSSIINYEDIISDNSTRIDKSIPRDLEFQGTSSAGRLLIGAYTTEDFGTFKSTGFASLYLGSSKFSPKDSYEFDSLVMSVKVDYVYGEQENFMGTKKIYIHELEEEIKLDSLYLTKNANAYIPEPIGELNIDISAFDTVGVDTVFSARISDELGQRFLDQAKADPLTFENNLEFRKYFDGLAFVSDASNEVVTGIIPESQSTYMRLYFHDAKDTSSFTFFIPGWVYDTIHVSTTDTLIYGKNITRYYNNITLDRIGTPLEGIVDFHTDFETSNGLSYTQGSAGIFTKLDLEAYLNILDTIDYLVVNRAELHIPVEEYQDFLKPPSQLNLYIADENNKFIEVTDATGLDFVYATTNNRLNYRKDSLGNKGVYVGEVTDYIQGLSSGKITNKYWLVGQTSLWNSIISINRFVSVKEDISLKIYYSTLK